MKYLLSSNRTTTSLREYVKDLIVIHMLIRKKEIPYWSGGTDDLITGITDSEIRDSINDIVNDVISNISAMVSGISLSLSRVDINSSRVTITLDIGGSKEIFNLMRR